MKVRETIKELLRKNKCDNPALLFNKLLYIAGELSDSRDDKKDYLTEFENNLRENLDLCCFIEAMSSIPHAMTICTKTAYRLAIGLGYPSLVENGFLFHHTYGIPYIPGETLKGLARGVLLLSMYEKLKNENKVNSISELEKCLLSEENNGQKKEIANILESEAVEVIFSDGVKIEKAHKFFEKVFGTLKKRGEVIFFDAFPVGFRPKDFEADIMNPHYQKYYSSKGKDNPPADWENPVPIKFLTVRQGVKFAVRIGTAPLSEELSEDELKKVKVLLKVGLENFGVGGKKRKGYGWFEVST